MAKKEATENVSPATAAAQALNAARWSKKSKAERSAVGKSLAAARWGKKPPVSETGGRKSKTGS